MTGESGFAKEPTGAQAQLLHALVMRDLGCALRNRTVLMTIITVLGFCALMMPQFAGSAEELPFMGAFGYALVPLFSVLEVGGTIMLFAMAEERAHGTYEVMARAGATLPLLVASKLIAGIVLCVVISLVAALFSGMWNANLLEFAAPGDARERVLVRPGSAVHRAPAQRLCSRGRHGEHGVPGGVSRRLWSAGAGR